MSQLIEIKTKSKSFKKFSRLAPKIFASVEKSSKKLKDKKIFHINSTKNGGGVAELLQSQISYEKSLGIDSRWFYIKAPEKFFKITKKMHNLLQGKPDALSASEKAFYLKQNKILEKSFEKIVLSKKPDLIIIHDTQPAPLINRVENKIPTILRLHIDLSSPEKSIILFLKEFIEKYDSIILTHSSYKPQWLKKSKTEIIMPAIDPFTEKNEDMPIIKAKKILSGYGIDVHKPLITQVSRFDPWKDPLGVIKAYKLAKKEIPDLQLALVGFFETPDDPEMALVYKKVKKESNGDNDIFLFSDLKKLREPSDNPLINAAYTASDVILQKSIKEGFGLTVTEAMWKSKTVIGGNTTGIKTQIQNNKNGFIVSNPEQAAKLIIKLINNPKLNKTIGKKARQTVKDNFLMPRLILEHLNLYIKLIKK